MKKHDCEKNLELIVESPKDLEFYKNTKTSEYIQFLKCSVCNVVYRREIKEHTVLHTGNMDLEYIKYVAGQAGPSVIQKVLVEQDESFKREWDECTDTT